MLTAPSIDPRLEDTAPPGLLAVREWARPAVASHAAVTLTAARLTLKSADGRELMLPLAGVRRAALGLATDAVEIDHDQLPLPARIRFADAATADEFFARLVRRSGAGYDLGTDAPTQLGLARGPVGVMAAVLVATAVLAATVAGLPDVLANSPTPPAWLRLLARLDWRLVTGAGGALLAAAQVSLLRRLARPPARMVLVRSELITGRTDAA